MKATKAQIDKFLKDQPALSDKEVWEAVKEANIVIDDTKWGQADFQEFKEFKSSQYWNTMLKACAKMKRTANQNIVNIQPYDKDMVNRLLFNLAAIQAAETLPVSIENAAKLYDPTGKKQ